MSLCTLNISELAVNWVKYSPGPGEPLQIPSKQTQCNGLNIPLTEESHYKFPQSNCNAWLGNPSKPIIPHITGKLSRWQATHWAPPRSASQTLLERKSELFAEEAMPRDEETVDRIFAGNLDGLPPLSSKVFFRLQYLCHSFDLFQGGAYLHQFHLHWHVDGEEHVDGIRLSQDQGVLPWEARTGIPGFGHFELGRREGTLFLNWKQKLLKFWKELISVQVVDMRWGVRDEMTDEHMTTVSTNLIG